MAYCRVQIVQPPRLSVQEQYNPWWLHSAPESARLQMLYVLLEPQGTLARCCLMLEDHGSLARCSVLENRSLLRSKLKSSHVLAHELEVRHKNSNHHHGTQLGKLLGFVAQYSVKEIPGLQVSLLAQSWDFSSL